MKKYRKWMGRELSRLGFRPRIPNAIDQAILKMKTGKTVTRIWEKP